MIAFGADIGWRRVSLAAVDDAGNFAVETFRLASDLGDQEVVVGLHERTLAIATELQQQFGEPSGVLVERPFGKFVEAKLHYSYAVVTLALEQTFPGAVAGQQPNQWKKAALGVGFGAAKKPVIMEWAQRQGYTGTDQDEADALGIATAALILTTAAPDQEQLTIEGVRS